MAACTTATLAAHRSSDGACRARPPSLFLLAMTSHEQPCCTPDKAMKLALLVQATAFFKQPFRAWHSSRQLVEYMVLDCEPAGPSNDKFASADIQVCMVACTVS